eukprot:2783458-Pyramimonas_sp.AAC.1
MSTAFSGIGAPENAMTSICSHLGVSPSQPLYAIEWNQECRRELSASPRRPICMFSDVNDFWSPDRYVDQSWTLSNFTSEIKKGGAVVLSGAYCSLHDSWTCKLTRAKLHVAGTPCPDWSSQGLRQGEHGSDLMATMAWTALRFELEDDIFMNENVIKFPPDLWWSRAGHKGARDGSRLAYTSRASCAA